MTSFGSLNRCNMILFLRLFLLSPSWQLLFVKLYCGYAKGFFVLIRLSALALPKAWRGVNCSCSGVCSEQTRELPLRSRWIIKGLLWCLSQLLFGTFLYVSTVDIPTFHHDHEASHDSAFVRGSVIGMSRLALWCAPITRLPDDSLYFNDIPFVLPVSSLPILCHIPAVSSSLLQYRFITKHCPAWALMAPPLTQKVSFPSSIPISTNWPCNAPSLNTSLQYRSHTHSQIAHQRRSSQGRLSSGWKLR